MTNHIANTGSKGGVRTEDFLKKNLLNIVLILFLLIFPTFTNTYYMDLFAKYMAYTIFAFGFSILWGYSGILSFGHSAYFALGAYTVCMVLKYLGGSELTLVALLLSILVPMVIAGIFGYFVFYGRVNGVFFGIMTLAFTTILMQVFINFSSFTGGTSGIRRFADPIILLPGGLNIDLTQPKTIYYVAFVIMLAVYYGCKRLVNSPFGRILNGLKDNESRMEFLGYNVPFIKMVVFMLAGGLAGLGGGLFAPVSFTSPTLFEMAFSTNVIIWVAIGGRENLAGCFVGVFLINFLGSVLSSALQDTWQLFIGMLMIVVVVFWPKGIMGSIKHKFGKTFIG